MDDDVLLVQLRLSCNMKDETLDEVIGKMQKSHISLLDGMTNSLRHSNVPAAILKPLHNVRRQAFIRGRDFFNVSDLYNEATKDALLASEDCLKRLALDETWLGVQGSPEEIAAQMRACAELCARDDEERIAAELLIKAVERVPEPEHETLVHKATGYGMFQKIRDEREKLALVAASRILASGPVEAPWPLTLLELAKIGAPGQIGRGSRTTPDRLAIIHNQPTFLVQIRLFDQDATTNTRKGNSLLSGATRGDTTAVLTALESGALVNDGYGAGDVTALHLAARAKNSEVVQILLKANADPNKRTGRGCTALGLAAEEGADDVVGILLDAGADPNSADDAGYTPCIGAAQAGHAGCITKLAAKGADLDAVEKRWNTALIRAAQGGFVDAVKALVQGGATVDKGDDDDFTPVCCAAQAGHADALAALIELGGNKDHQEGPLYLAARLGHDAAIKVLLDAGATAGAERAIQICEQVLDGNDPTGGHRAALEMLRAKFPAVAKEDVGGDGSDAD